MIPTSSSVSTWFDQLLLQIAYEAVQAARAAVLAVLHAFGAGTEPDFGSIVPVYDRMLAIALLLVGVFICGALIERCLGGQQGAGWAVIPRTLLAVFCAFAGLEVVQYLASYAALLATVWSPDLTSLGDKLGAIAQPGNSLPHGKHLPLGSVVSLIFIALLMDFMAVVVYLELLIRAALVLIVTAFIPIVCAMSIWPRMAGAITHLGEFLIGLLLAKFVIATVAYIGFRLVVSGFTGGRAADGQADWIVTGVAVLCIAAFSPVVLVQGLRFTHSTAGSVARSWVGSGTSIALSAPRIAGSATGLIGRPIAALGALRRVRRKVKSARSTPERSTKP